MSRNLCSLLCILVVLLGGFAQAQEKNFVYRGSRTTVQIDTGKSSVKQCYYIFGPETVLDENYARRDVTLIEVGGILGKKRYRVLSFGTFRTLELSQLVNGKTRTREILSLCNADATESGNGFHSGVVSVLSGRHTNPLYPTPLVLSGAEVVSGGQSMADGPALGSASRTNVRLSLVRSLTDAGATGEGLTTTVQRVKDDLNSRGFIELLP